MCGLAGIVSFGGTRIDESIAGALGAALAHRGPDGEGTYASRGVLLVHRRLAIIDPSPRAAQPMASPDARYRLVYNGEVYNHRELRIGLEGRGEQFRTASDTEVLLRLLAREGPAGLARVRGMFALALWDERERTLLLARDRFGIKPLYVSHAAGRIVFASEVGALRRAGLVPRTVSAAGVLAYLAWASVPPPLTWLDDVEALQPATWRRYTADGASTEGLFADPRAAYVTGDAECDEPALRAATAAAVRQAVRAHLVSDVPVGVFLSGGVDSGAIVSAARDVSAGDLRTYTVVVDEAGHSEAAAAEGVARLFGTTHHVLTVDAAHVAADLPSIVQRLDQPTADAVNTYYVSRAVAATGVKAVLSGIGGDEMFGGYPSFDRVPVALKMSHVLGPAMPVTGALATVALPAWRAAKWRHFAQDPEIDQGYRALRGFFMPEELPSLVGPALKDTAVHRDAHAALALAEERLFAACGPERPVASVARLETRGFLGAQLLRDVDAMSMAHGLEVRVPFVDADLQRVVWPALALHPSLLKGKRLLHDTLARPLPPEVTGRPKQGFTLPFASWMRGPLQDAVRDGLDALAGSGWVGRDAPDTVWTAFARGQAHWSRAWGLGMLGRFLADAP
ncbi:MAG: asparagine synthase (glutamine-hydrolyzing) [Vicinamibacterales bacterium]